jgi:hypothetical protein
LAQGAHWYVSGGNGMNVQTSESHELTRGSVNRTIFFSLKAHPIEAEGKMYAGF